MSAATSMLKEHGICEKAATVEETAECRLVACESKRLFLIAFSEYIDWVYAKIIPEYGLPLDKWHCGYVYYTPYGLYVFAKSLDELVRKIGAKMRLLNAIAKLAAERATLMQS